MTVLAVRFWRYRDCKHTAGALLTGALLAQPRRVQFWAGTLLARLTIGTLLGHRPHYCAGRSSAG
eukprot:1398010-Rhodomonas_salina.1